VVTKKVDIPTTTTTTSTTLIAANVELLPAAAAITIGIR
jgi:hypothetical protein